MNPNRTLARNLAAESVGRGEPLEWFEKLYCQAQGDESVIPWADMKVNPNFGEWLAAAALPEATGRALIIGCGLGDDAEALQSAGLQVTAFDISETCIAWCRRRFPESTVDYTVADVFVPPASWRRAFNLVLEAYTLQVLPENLRQPAMRQIAEFVAPDGRLLVIARGRDASDNPGQMPWPLVRTEFSEFVRPD